MTLPAGAPLHLCEVRTTVLLWPAVADHWRARAGGTAGAVTAAARVALEAPGRRAAIPSPDLADVAAVDEAGRLLNQALKVRYARGAGAGDVAAALLAVRDAARQCGSDMHARPVRRCVGKVDRLVKLRLDPGLREEMRAAAAGWGMSLGGWVRDGVAGALGEHTVRQPAAATAAARQALGGRLVGLLVQAEIVAAGGGESAAVRLATDAVAAATQRLTVGGAGRSRWNSKERRPARHSEVAAP